MSSIFEPDDAFEPENITAAVRQEQRQIRDKLRRQAEDELMKELSLDGDEECGIGGANMNIYTLWSALVKERIETIRQRERLHEAGWAETNRIEDLRRQRAQEWR